MLFHKLIGTINHKLAAKPDRLFLLHLLHIKATDMNPASTIFNTCVHNMWPVAMTTSANSGMKGITIKAHSLQITN